MVVQNPDTGLRESRHFVERQLTACGKFHEVNFNFQLFFSLVQFVDPAFF